MSRSKIIIFISIVIILIAVSTPFLLRGRTYVKYLQVNEKVFKVEVADNDVTLEKGLSGRPELGGYEGMLFVFQKPDKYGFWMKDMNFSLDIIWLDNDLRVVHIEKSVSPKTYPKVFYPESDSMYVLEISAGQSDKAELKIGDTIEILKK